MAAMLGSISFAAPARLLRAGARRATVTSAGKCACGKTSDAAGNCDGACGGKAEAAGEGGGDSVLFRPP